MDETNNTILDQERAPRWWDVTRDFFWELAKVFVFSVAIIIPVRYFLVQPFYVRGASMVPNFHDKDYLVIDEISYGVRIPFTEAYIPISNPIRGEAVVIRYPKDPTQYFIKRIIGLPGETVLIRENHITIYNETAPEGVQLEEPYLNADAIMRGEYSMELGSDEYVVLGDNRDASLDSRSFGPITRDAIVGRAWIRGWPFDRVGHLVAPSYDI